jgi:hypothetical protein
VVFFVGNDDGLLVATSFSDDRWQICDRSSYLYKSFAVPFGGKSYGLPRH